MRLPFNSCKDVVTHVNETSLCSDTACRLTEMSRSDVFLKQKISWLATDFSISLLMKVRFETGR